jgi:hypothetical protein
MFQHKRILKPFPQSSMLLILALVLGACNNLYPAGASAPGTSGAVENEPGVQALPNIPTQRPEDTEQPPLLGQHDYTNDFYGFEFTYPDTWTLEEEDHAVVLEQDSLRLRINYAWATEDIGPGLFGRTGIGAGDFIYAGKVNFMGQEIPVDALVYEGKTKAIFYGQGKLIEENDLVFMIVLEGAGEDYGVVDIPEMKQAEASLIVEALRRTTQAAQCLRQGGRWEVLGFSGPGCNLPTSDDGKPCSDSQECEGLCLADKEEINANGVDLPGVCSAWQSTFGCQVVVENGKVVEICID